MTRMSLAAMLTLSALVGCTPPTDQPVPTAQRRNEMMALPPRPTTKVLGRSVLSEPIEMHVFGEGPSPVLVIGGIHGSEPTSVVVAQRLSALLLQRPDLWHGPGGQSVAILPIANPDGYARLARTNVNGVDVNRNFPAQNWKAQARPNRPQANGPEPLSEPESRAIFQAIQTLNPRLIISIHSIDDGRHCNNYDGPAEVVARLMSQYNGYPVTATMGYPTPGSLGSYAGIDRQIPIVTLELPRTLPGEQAWAQNREALLAALAYAHRGDALGN